MHFQSFKKEVNTNFSEDQFYKKTHNLSYAIECK